MLTIIWEGYSSVDYPDTIIFNGRRARLYSYHIANSTVTYRWEDCDV